MYLHHQEKTKSVFKRFTELVPGDVGISTITLAELEYGVEKSSNPNKNRDALLQFLLPLEIWDFDFNAALVFGRIRAELERKGTPIGAYDLQIAAHALSLQKTLVTNNTREFERVVGLKLDNWV